MALDIRSKLPATGTTIFTVMSALAHEHGAVNLGQGFPDYSIDPTLIDLVDAAMRAGHNQYPLMPGVMRLREAIAAKVSRLYGHAYDPEHEVTVTTGATQAIFTSIQALAHRGRRSDRVRARVRQLRAGSPPFGRDAGDAAAHDSGLRHRLGRAARRRSHRARA